MRNIKSNEEEKKELHKLIDSSTNDIVISLSKIFKAIKLDNSEEINEVNKSNISRSTDIVEKMDSIIDDINNLININNKMKLRRLKFKELKSDNTKVIDPKIKNDNERQPIEYSFKIVSDLNKNIENVLLTKKLSSVYKISSEVDFNKLLCAPNDKNKNQNKK